MSANALTRPEHEASPNWNVEVTPAGWYPKNEPGTRGAG